MAARRMSRGRPGAGLQPARPAPMGMAAAERPGCRWAGRADSAPSPHLEARDRPFRPIRRSAVRHPSCTPRPRPAYRRRGGRRPSARSARTRAAASPGPLPRRAVGEGCARSSTQGMERRHRHHAWRPQRADRHGMSGQCLCIGATPGAFSGRTVAATSTVVRLPSLPSTTSVSGTVSPSLTGATRSINMTW